MTDARFEDIGAGPINIGALDDEDLSVLSALCQDSVIKIGDIAWRKSARTVALLLQRFRWEENTPEAERVQSMLVIDQALAMAAQGIDPQDKDGVLSLLSVEFETPDEDESDPSGDVLLKFSGDATLRIHVEALELRLRDVTRPYGAVSQKRPNHSL